MNNRIEDIVIIGTGGFAREIIYLMEEINISNSYWNILGLIGEKQQLGKRILGYDVIGDDNWLLNCQEQINVVCAVGNPSLKKKIIEKIKINSNIHFPILIARNVYISSYVNIGAGCIICAGCIITTDIKLEEFVTVNLACTIGHDVTLGKYSTINPGTHISGNVTVGEETELGTGSNIIQGIHIGSRTIIGAGAVVIRDIPAQCTAVGNPARIIT